MSDRTRFHASLYLPYFFMCLCLGILAPRGANSADPSIRVTDKFGRVLNEFGIVLVDWETG